MLSPLLYELGLLVAVGAGWAVGRWLAQRYRGKPRSDGQHGDAPGSARLTDTIGFVGGAYGILLGLLLVFAVGHFVDARQVTKDEAAAAARLFTAVNPYPAADRDPLRHGILCYMESAATDDWAAMRAGDGTGSDDTAAYATAVQEQIEALPQDEDVESSNHYFVTEANLDLANYRQQRLLHAVPEIPPVIWVVLYVSAFVFVGLMVFHLGQRRWLTRLAVAATTVLLVALVGALIQLDAPYIGVGTSLRPVALEAALARLHDAYAEDAALWEACEPITAESAGG